MIPAMLYCSSINSYTVRLGPEPYEATHSLLRSMSTGLV